MLGVCESTLSKLRHQKLKKIPSALSPASNLEQFIKSFFQNFVEEESFDELIAVYGNQLVSGYVVSGQLTELVRGLDRDVRYGAERGEATTRQQEFLTLCYAEAYNNSVLTNLKTPQHKLEASEIAFQKICGVLDQELLEEKNLSELMDVIYAASLRKQLGVRPKDNSYRQLVKQFTELQEGLPNLKKSRRTEIISINEDNTFITRKISVQEQLVMKNEPAEYRWSYVLYHAPLDGAPETVEKYVGDFFCTVDGVPLKEYLAGHKKYNAEEAPGEVCQEDYLFAKTVHDDLCGTRSTSLVFSFPLFPRDDGAAVSVAWSMTFTVPMVPNVSVNYSYHLPYDCKFLEHEFILDSRTRKKWGVRLEIFAPLSGGGVKSHSFGDRLFTQNSGSLDSRRVTFYDWAPAGSGYSRNLFELKYAE